MEFKLMSIDWIKNRRFQSNYVTSKIYYLLVKLINIKEKKLLILKFWY